MKRDKITIDNNGFVTLTGSDVWMTETELAELFDTTVGAINAGIKSIVKNNCRYVRLENGNSADVYNMEVVGALAFRLNTRGASIFRKWLIGRATAPMRQVVAPIVVGYRDDVVC